MALVKIILVNDDVCTGCKICELACAFKKEGEFNPKKAAIHVVNWPKDGLSVPMLCQQCKKPNCASVCPVEALTKNAETGVVELNTDLCVGCNVCISACPFGSIGRHAEMDVVIKCNHCGGSPECVRLCPTKALQYVKEETAATLKKRSLAEAVRKLSRISSFEIQ
jgi:Fe-S-cluster-containing hydrogenase component 2